VTVAATLILKSTTTGDELWKYRGMLQVDTSGGNMGGGIAGLIAKVIVTAINTAGTDYVPIAKRVSHRTVASMPYGKYHPACAKDGSDQIIMQVESPAQAQAQ